MIRKKKRKTRTVHKRILLYSLLILLIGTAILLMQTQQSQHLTSKAATNCDVSSADLAIKPEEQKLFDLLNAWRARSGAGKLQWDQNLKRSAQWLSNDMNAKNYHDHIDSLGRSPNTRMKECGVPNVDNGFGEAIDAGANANDVLNHLGTSATYNKIITDQGYNRVGIAQAGQHWTLDFLQVGNNPAPNPTGVVNQPTARPTSKPTTAVVPSPNCLGSCPTTPTPTSQQTIPTTTQPAAEPTNDSSEEPTDSMPQEDGQIGPTLSTVPLDTNPGQGNPQKGKLGLLALILQFIITLLQLILGR